MKYEFGDKLRTVRKRKGYTMKQVAVRAGISESLVSQIERNRVSPAIDTLLNIAAVLEIDPDYLFRDLRQSRQVNVVRRDARQRIMRDGVVYERLARTPGETEAYGIEAYYMEIEPGAASGSEMYGHRGRELGTIVSGCGEFTIGNETLNLQAGDSISFAADAPHMLRNTGTEPLRAWWTITPPKMFKD